MTELTGSNAGTAEEKLNSVGMVSVLVVARNEQNHVAKCLQSLLEQDVPESSYEIIVVDGMSTDHTRERIGEVMRAYPKRTVRIINNPQKNLSSGWNLGIRAAKGEYVVRPDAHAELPSCFLRDNIRVMCEHPEAAAVGGMVETVGRGFVGETIAAALSSRFGVGGACFRVGGNAGYADTAAYGLYRRQVLIDVGGFDPAIGRNQDVACHGRMRKAGHRFYFDPTIRSRYYCRSSIGRLAKQMFGNGRWLPLLVKHDIGKVFGLRYFVPMLFVLSLLLLGVGALWTAWAGVGLVAVLSVYMLGAIGAALRQRISLAQMAMFPVITLTMHVSYGVGWIAGLLEYPFHKARGYAGGLAAR